MTTQAVVSQVTTPISDDSWNRTSIFHTYVKIRKIPPWDLSDTQFTPFLVLFKCRLHLLLIVFYFLPGRFF